MLDVGTASGFLSFEAEMRGAAVVSVEADSPARWNCLPFAQKLSYIDRDAWDRDPGVRDHLDGLKRSYWLAHREFGSRARVFYGDACDLPEGLGRFDVVIVGQILVHMQDVVRALTSISRRAADTVILAEGMLDTDQPTSRFLGSAHEPDHDRSFWRHSVGVYRELLGMLGFSLEARRTRKFTCNVDGHPKAMPITTLVFKRGSTSSLVAPRAPGRMSALRRLLRNRRWPRRADLERKPERQSTRPEPRNIGPPAAAV